MDPEFLTHADWSGLGGLLRFLWFFSASVVAFALNMLLAQAIVPSLVASNHLPQGMLRVRRMFLAVAMSALVLAVIMLVIVVMRLSVIAGFYEKWWI